MTLNCVCEVLGTSWNPNGRLVLELKFLNTIPPLPADPPLFDNRLFWAKEVYSREWLAIALTAIASKKRVRIRSDDFTQGVTGNVEDAEINILHVISY
jgi:hypothetical protein